MTERPRVLVTGAAGFVGRHAVPSLDRAGYDVRAAVRGTAVEIPGMREAVQSPDLAQPFDAAPLVEGVDFVVHLSGLAHATSAIPEALYQAVNAEAAKRLAAAARDAGVRRFVFLSSVRAQTGASAAGIVTEDRAAEPTDAYGRSKLMGEKLVAEALAGSKTEFAVLRPVLVYGAGVKGNMGALMRLARSRLPLPFARLTARRSLISAESLAGAIAHVLRAPAAAGETFLAAEDGALTIAEIVTSLRAGLGRQPLLLPLPQRSVELALRALRRSGDFERLSGNLEVSAAALKATGWRPSCGSRDGLAGLMRQT